MVPHAGVACYAPSMNPDWDPAAYDYDFHESQIAHAPAEPRDAAKLLVYNRASKAIEHAVFRDLPKLLEPGSLIVLNDTRVIAARFEVRKPTGGTARVLYLRMRDGLMEALADRRLDIGSTLLTADARKLQVIGKEGSVYLIQPEFDDVTAFLEAHGTTPLPPYIETTLSQKQARDEYQTIFAKKPGSAAAPTASLHFTGDLLDELLAKGIELAYVTLHVGLGTFAPLTEEAVESGTLHHEWYEVPQETVAAIMKAQLENKPVIAVGTTVTRALESAAAQGEITAGPGETNMFIRPGYTFRVVDQLITNFHVPRSSLMMLVASLTGREELLRIYEEAIADSYRLFSFGDAMLIR